MRCGSPDCLPKTVAERKQLRTTRLQERRRRGFTRKDPGVAHIYDIMGNLLPSCSEFKYLGTFVSNTATITPEIRRRTGMARTAMKKLRRIWKNRRIPRGMKGILYQVLVITIALYNVECWKLTKTDEKLLKGFEASALKTILRAHERVSQEEARTGWDEGSGKKYFKSREEQRAFLDVPTY